MSMRKNNKVNISGLVLSQVSLKRSILRSYNYVILLLNLSSNLSLRILYIVTQKGVKFYL